MLGAHLLERLQLARDAGTRPESPLRFPDGAHYRVEIPSVEGPVVCAAVLDEAERRGIAVQRVSQGSGVTMLTRDERAELARAGAAHAIEVSLYVRPTASWGTGAAWLAPTGHPLAGQVHGLSQLGAALDQVERAVGSGFRSVLVTDLGVLAAVAELKRQGACRPTSRSRRASSSPWPTRCPPVRSPGSGPPPSTSRATSASTTSRLSGRPSTSRWTSTSSRRTTWAASSAPTRSPRSCGWPRRSTSSSGWNAAPQYPGGTHTEEVAARLGRERVRRAQLGLELLHETAPTLTTSARGAADLGIPRPAGAPSANGTQPHPTTRPR